MEKTRSKEIKKYEEMKTNAVARLDGSAYVEACGELGIEPDVPDLYEQGLAEIRYVELNSFAKGENGGLEDLANKGSNDVTKSVKTKRKKTNRPSVINMTYKDAIAMSNEYTEMDEQYLRSLVRNHIPYAENVLSCSDRKYLLHMTRTIKGVADKLVKSYNKKHKK